MLFKATITKWESHRDSKNRVGALDLPTGREYIINTNRISDLVSIGANSCKFKYIENSEDRREIHDRVWANESIAALEAAHNTVASKSIILPVYQNNNILRNTVNTVLLVDNIVYADAYNPAPLVASWVVYIKDGFKRVEILVSWTLNEILNLSSAPLYDYDGNEYGTVVIGTNSQEWIVQNLRTTHYGDGTAIPLIDQSIPWLADVSGCYCYYNNNELNGPIYGALYNWYATTNAHGLAYFIRNGVQEAGWRVPSMADWEALITAIGGDYSIAGDLLKEAGDAHWAWGVNEGTNTYGLTLIGSGNRLVDSDDGLGFASMGSYSDTWCTDTDPTDITHGLSIYAGAASSFFSTWAHEKFGGMAVRCLRDV